MSTYEYLPGIIPLVFFEFFIVLGIVYWLYKRQLRQADDGALGGQLSLFEQYFHGQSFEKMYESSTGTHNGMIMLLVFRLFFLFGFFSVPFVWSYDRSGGTSAYFFTLWNINLIVVYFGSASFASILGFMYDKELKKDPEPGNSGWLHGSDFWSKHVTNIGYTIQILFEIAGGSAFFITIVVFFILNPEFSFWNVMHHFVTSIALITELCLNSLIVRWEHLALNLIWALLYLIFIWPLRGSNAITEWPYDFLRTDTPSSFVWYTGLALGNILFYLLWYYLYRFKVEKVLPCLAKHHVVLAEQLLTQELVNEGNNSPIHP